MGGCLRDWQTLRADKNGYGMVTSFYLLSSELRLKKKTDDVRLWRGIGFCGDAQYAESLIRTVEGNENHKT